MEAKGDIPEKEEVKPINVDTKLGVIKEVLDNGGTAHVYLRHSEDDVHLYDYATHVFEDVGVIYTQVDEVDMWIFPQDVTAVERHYE